MDRRIRSQYEELLTLSYRLCQLIGPAEER
jgi:hypothetical protein